MKEMREMNFQEDFLENRKKVPLPHTACLPPCTDELYSHLSRSPGSHNNYELDI